MSRRRWLVLPLAVVVLAVTMAACASSTTPGARPARNEAGCPAAVAGVIRAAPASASDPATGTWLGRVDRLRDRSRKSADVVSRLLASELDYAGAQAALGGFPPQLAIIPAQETCTISSLESGSAPASVIPATRAWLRANPVPARHGMTAGIITAWANRIVACPAPRRGSDMAVGNGCYAWSLTLTTATGTIRAFCGNLSNAVACTSAAAKPGPRQYFPETGNELFVPSSGHITRTADIAIISQPPWNAWNSQPARSGGS